MLSCCRYHVHDIWQAVGSAIVATIVVATIITRTIEVFAGFTIVTAIITTVIAVFTNVTIDVAIIATIAISVSLNVQSDHHGLVGIS
eukprot:5863745-Lingulodinium_polyedra.AAC.2